MCRVCEVNLCVKCGLMVMKCYFLGKMVYEDVWV